MARQDAAAGTIERFLQVSLLGLVTAGFLAIAGAGILDTPTVALMGLGLALRALAVCGFFRVDVSDRAITFTTLGYFAFFALDYLALSRSLLVATVHLAFFLAAVKIVTAKTSRDYLYTALIGFLELVAAASVSADLHFFLFFALFLTFAIAALASAEIRRSLQASAMAARASSHRFGPRLWALALSAAAGILVLTVGLFFLLPRTADAALARMVSHRLFLPGFSSKVSIGEVGELQTSSRPVMHIRIFHTERLAGLKWRGGALSSFDGKLWGNSEQHYRMPTERGHANLLPSEERRVGTHISYDVQFDAIDTDALFFAGVPEGIDVSYPYLIRDAGGGFSLGHRPPDGFRYEAYSLLEGPPESMPVPSPAPVLDADSAARNLQLPVGLDPRIPALARDLTGGTRDELERARALERHLRRDYGYTLSLPSRETRDPLAYFLFTRRKGHCEYFASAMAVLLRTLGVPARLAIGFESGIYNPFTDLWVIRASDAHTWVEAWIPGHGWTTFDPTPSDPNAGTVGPLARLSLYLDAATTFWHEWVVEYDLSRQSALADRVERRARRMGLGWFDSLVGLGNAWDLHAAVWLRRFGLLLVWVLLAALAAWQIVPRAIRLAKMRRRVENVRRGKATVADATLLYRRMLHVVRRHGYQKPAWFTPGEFAASVPPGPLGGVLAEFTVAYNALRYGGRTEVAPRLGRLLDELERLERS